MLVLQNSEKDHLLLKIEHQLSFGKDSSSTNEKFMPVITSQKSDLYFKSGQEREMP